MLELLTCQVREGHDLTESEAELALQSILAEDTADSVIAEFLVCLAEKGESESEITGFARVMRQHAIRISCDREQFIDTAGTGGGRSTFNVSTTAAIIAAGAGICVAKHGNRAVTSRSGSADVLAELGINLDRPPEVSEEALNRIGICFLFAPLFHPSMKRVSRIRRELGRQTIFNLVGPLTNPASAPCQIVGASSPDLTDKLGGALLRLGCRRAWVVHGLDGMDELSVGGDTKVCEIADSQTRSFYFKPLPNRMPLPCGGSPRENAQLIQGILDGVVLGPARDIALLNAAAAIHVAEAIPFSEASKMATESLVSGAAGQKLNQLIECYS